MKVLGIIPARGGSKRIPGKNVRPLGGKPLVRWAIDAALGARRLDRVVVSSDDERVLELAGPLALRRPPELAGDTSPAVDYVIHALDTLGGGHDAVAIIQPTSPFTLASDIDATIALLEQSGADTAVSVMEIDHAIHPVKLKTMSGDRLMPYLEEERGRMAAHELPKLFVRNCSVYVTRARVVREEKQIIGKDCRGYVMPPERSLDINIERDFLFAEFLLERGSK